MFADGKFGGVLVKDKRRGFADRLFRGVIFALGALALVAVALFALG
ncbi:MAG: hypothetical protein M3Q49_06485 [Actinomycetota bacterium]|nr:hypothetical protein [Actinomycetota bacterium]MDP9485425.1 hypothetical protein [Actinomycetota bacterium]